MRIYAIMQPEPYKTSFYVGKNVHLFYQHTVIITLFWESGLRHHLETKGFNKITSVKPFFCRPLCYIPLSI